jgi:hypothetical protein
MDDMKNKTTLLVNAVYADMEENFSEWKSPRPLKWVRYNNEENTTVLEFHVKSACGCTKTTYIDRVPLTDTQSNCLRKMTKRKKEELRQNKLETSFSDTFDIWGIE